MMYEQRAVTLITYTDKPTDERIAKGKITKPETKNVGNPWASLVLQLGS